MQATPVIIHGAGDPRPQWVGDRQICHVERAWVYSLFSEGGENERDGKKKDGGREEVGEGREAEAAT